MSWFFLVPGRVPGLVSLFFWHSVPHHFCFLLVPARVPEFVFLSFPVSGKGFCFIVICWLLLVFATVLGLISLFSFCSFSGKGLCYIVIFWFLLVPGWGSVACPPSFLSFLFSGMGRPMNSLLCMNVVETWFVAVWGLCWCNFFFFFFFFKSFIDTCIWIYLELMSTIWMVYVKTATFQNMS